MEKRFGIPKTRFDAYFLFRRKANWYLLRKSPQVMLASSLKISKLGLRAFRKIGGFIKPTTMMIQVFGHAATRAVIHINENQLMRLLSGKGLDVALNVEAGYVIIVLEKSSILGLGFYANGGLKSQFPRKDFSMDRIGFQSMNPCP